MERATFPRQEGTARTSCKARLAAEGALRTGQWEALRGNEELIVTLGERVLSQVWQTDEERGRAVTLTRFRRA